MKKNNKKASILLWAVMLSLIIAITFITISVSINKNIKSSGKINNFIDERNKILIAINSGTINKISENKLLINPNKYEKYFGLKKDEKLNFYFSGTNDFNINIGIINGGPIKYKYIFDKNITSSGIINSSNSFSGKLDNNSKTGTLDIINLGGYAELKINSENEFETGEKNYKIITKIGNNFFNETKNVQ